MFNETTTDHDLAVTITVENRNFVDNFNPP